MQTIETQTARCAWVPAAVLAVLAGGASAATWSGGTGNWSGTGNGVGVGFDVVPNGTGAVATFGAVASATTTQDISAGVTVGKVELIGSGTTGTRTIAPNNALTFRQDGAGIGNRAVISHANTYNGASRLSLSNVGTITLDDDVLITHTGTSTGSYSIGITSTIASAPSTNTNLNLYNVSNNPDVAPIHIGANNGSYTGTVTIEKGVVTLANPGFGGSGNAVFLGSAGNGSATLLTTGSTTNIPNPITAVAGTGGTLLLGSISGAASNSIFSGGLTLNADVTLTSAKASGADVRYTGAISGSGSVTTAGAGETQLGNGSSTITNTYTGNTTLTQTSSFVLSDNASMKFVIGASGVNNKISGTNNNVLALEGDFSFDLTNAASNGSWTIVDVGTVTETFASSFQVLGGFTQNSNVWTLVDGDVTYTFTEATGVLTAVPEPGMLAGIAGLALLATRRRAR